MGDEKKGRGKKAGKTDEGKQPEGGRSRARNKAELVHTVIQKIEERLIKEELKPTVGDFIRLLQLEKELEDEQPREITVSWVEPARGEEESAPAE